MDKIYISGFEGKTIAIPIESSKIKLYTISELKLLVKEETKMPVENQRFLHGPKELHNFHGLKAMTFEDYGIKSGAIIILVNRLPGVVPESDPFFARKVEYSASRTCGHFFNDKRDKTRTVNFPHPEGNCNTCGDESGLRMQCGHFICPDDLLDWAWEKLSKMKYEIACTQCTRSISQDDILKFGLPTLEEKQFLITAITTNYCESQDIQKCPECRTLCQRSRTDNPQVQCTVCLKRNGKPFMFCWYCVNEWQNLSNNEVCGNSKCKREIIERLINSPKFEIVDRKGKKVTIPKIRACPNCQTLLEHADGFSTLTCNKCGLKFCFICLTSTSGGSLICKSLNVGPNGIQCTPAPIQTKLK